MKHRLLRGLAGAMLLGLILGALFLYIGLQHGTQSEFYLESGALDIWYCFLIFAAWFVVGTAVGWALYGVYRALLYPFGKGKRPV